MYIRGQALFLQGGAAFSLLLIFRVKYTSLLRASSNPLARLLQPTNVLLYIHQLVARLTLYERILTTSYLTSLVRNNRMSVNSYLWLVH